jgi:hypothetical protein
VSKSERKAWCSWCYEYSTHALVGRNVLSRSEYRCESCNNYTIKCRYCSNMATHRPARASEASLLQRIKEGWASELCAEHNGSVRDFTKLDLRLSCLSEFEDLRRRKRINLNRGAKIAGGIIGGAAVFCPISYVLAPSFAAALGSAGLLGVASTGAAISTLHGAALTSASLAAIGPGGMAGGVVLLTAAGAALGGKEGAAIAGNYFGAVKDFNILKVRDGKGPALIFVNGFLSQKNTDASDWLDATRKRYPDNPAYLVTWEASSMSYFGKLAATEAGPKAIEAVVSKLMSRQRWASKSMAHPLRWLGFVTGLLGNKWHGSMAKAQMTGLILADLIARTESKDGFILMGHSLGARVIHSLLSALSTTERRCIKEVYLLGGAVDGTRADTWGEIAKAVDGRIYNVYSTNDDVLSMLYRGANAFLSRPIGLRDIRSADSSIHNFDASTIVSGHMRHKASFGQVLERIPV